MSLLKFDTSSYLSSGGHGECQPCPACEGGKFRRLFVEKGRTFYQCQTCGLERQWPLPRQTQLNEYYEQSYRDGMYCDFVAADEMKVRTAKSRYRQIKRWCNVGPWLDVGCANGVFLKVLQEQNIEAEGQRDWTFRIWRSKPYESKAYRLPAILWAIYPRGDLKPLPPSMSWNT